MNKRLRLWLSAFRIRFGTKGPYREKWWLKPLKKK